MGSNFELKDLEAEIAYLSNAEKRRKEVRLFELGTEVEHLRELREGYREAAASASAREDREYLTGEIGLVEESIQRKLDRRRAVAGELAHIERLLKHKAGRLGVLVGRLPAATLRLDLTPLYIAGASDGEVEVFVPWGARKVVPFSDTERSVEFAAEEVAGPDRKVRFRFKWGVGFGHEMFLSARPGQATLVRSGGVPALDLPVSREVNEDYWNVVVLP